MWKIRININLKSPNKTFSMTMRFELMFPLHISEERPGPLDDVIYYYLTYKCNSAVLQIYSDNSPTHNPAELFSY